MGNIIIIRRDTMDILLRRVPMEAVILILLDLMIVVMLSHLRDEGNNPLMMKEGHLLEMETIILR
jgi:hypothetical protein